MAASPQDGTLPEPPLALGDEVKTGEPIREEAALEAENQSKSPTVKRVKSHSSNPGAERLNPAGKHEQSEPNGGKRPLPGLGSAAPCWQRKEALEEEWVQVQESPLTSEAN